MKKLIILLIPFIFMVKSYAYSYDTEYILESHMIQITEKIKIERNENYYLTFCELYSDIDYFKELEKENIQNKSLIIRTDSKNDKIAFQKEITDFGTVYYAKITNASDDYIYYMSYPATNKMYENKDNLFKLLNERDFKNLNILYDDLYEEEIKNDFDGIYYVDIDNLLLISDIKKSIKAVDNNDGPIDIIDISFDGYSGNNEIGDYYVEFKCQDESENISIFRLLIKIVDVTSPIIKSKDDNLRVVTGDKKKLTYNDLLSLVTVTDNTCLMDNRIRILKNDYFRNENKLGEYKVTYLAKDLYGNESTFDMIISVGGDSIIYNIEKFKTDNLSIKGAAELYFKSINKPDIKYTVTSDSYTKNENKVGIYEIGLSYEDDGLKHCVLKINVLDNIEKKQIEEETKKSVLPIIIIIAGSILLIGIGIVIYKKIKK